MPSPTPRAHRFFEWIDHTPGAAQKSGVPKKVAHDFVVADIGRKFGPKPVGKSRARRKTR
jgi:hypothetical protein